MAKRKRKNRNRREGVSSAANAPAGQSAAKSSRVRNSRNQRGLLLVAVVLLAIAAYLNLRRLGGDRLPEPIAFPNEEVVSRPLAKPSTGGEKRFALLSPSQTGIEFAHPVIPDHPMAYLYFSSMAAGGTAVGDVSGDGRPDIFVASGPEKNRLFIQKEQAFTFQDVTAKAGVDGGDNWACGATMVDINADGRLDIYVANYDAPNELFVNLGNGKFKNLAAEYALNITDASLEGAFADYDRDGFLDMYLVTYRYENPNGMPDVPPIVFRGSAPSIHPDYVRYYEITEDEVGYGTVGRSDGLLRNNGNGTFSDATSRAGIHGAAHGQSATWWDFNDDGFVDLHVGNDFNDPDRFYKNNGNGTFTDIVREAVPHITWFSMGADAGDLNGDGLLDLLTTDMSSTTHFKQKTTMGAMGSNAEFLSKAVPRQYMRNALLLNSGTDRFQEAAFLAGLDSTDWTWAVKLVDFDCDGRLDVFFTNGSVRSFTDSDRALILSERKGKTEWDIYKDTEPLREQNLAFRNEGELQFTNVSSDWGLDHLGVSMSSAHADFDGDGDLDLVVANVDEPMAIYRNDSQEGERISIRLHGLRGNRYGVGAKVTVTSSEGEQFAELQPSRGFLASNEPLLCFACGQAQQVDVTVVWPTGGVQKLSGLPTGRHFEVTERQGLAHQTKTTTPTMFESKNAASELAHVENEFDDYQLQPLLPHRMSRLGPAIAAADFNGDGNTDFFLGGAAGTPGRIVLGGEDGKLTASTQAALEADAGAEDMGAVWLDVEGDGDVDLFVAGGGNEEPDPEGEAYSLRLYLNDGRGRLTRAKQQLPAIHVSAGPVSAADFDQDGDVDLFVGGRQIPGKYPLPAKSYLLVNEAGVFVDKTIPTMDTSEIGMVTGSLWSDVDADNDLDLLVTTEWDHIHLFRNTDGRLADDSAAAGLTAYRGWWTGINAGDFDGDGSIDYIATNMGLNTKYHASDKHPFRLYYGDFEGNGVRQLVEAEYEGETLFPVRGKSCSTHAMPTLAEKFTTYKGFAAATLDEIYTTQCLQEAFECSANWLSSVALMNDGKGNFQFKPLPAAAQLSPGFGTVISEFTGDGIPDVFIAQNFFSPQPETGNMDGGLGCLLAGNGDGTFHALPPQETGIIVPEDATAVVQTQLGGNLTPDLLVATNNGDLRILERQSVANVGLRVVFAAARSSSQLAGTKITFRVSGLPDQMYEIAAGSGYLSQQEATAYFAFPSGVKGQLEVEYPDGQTVQREIAAEMRSVNLD